MDRDALARLSREQLIELVLALATEVAALQAQQRRPPKTPGNSSLPPSMGFKPKRVERHRGRGPKRGHLGISRRRETPDVIVRCRPNTCQGCGESLPFAGQRRVGRSQVVELPPIRPVVVEAWQYAARCRRCGTRTKGTYPAGLEPRRTFGPGIETVLASLHERHHLSYERLVELCGDVFRLPISEGATAALLARLAERARPTYEAIGAQVRAAPVMSSDETSARVNGRNWWQWVFQTPTASYHVIAASRGGAVIDAFLGGAKPEVWGSDLWAPQVGTAAGQHQICLAHQTRNLTYAVEADEPTGRAWARELRHVFGRALRLRHEREQVSPLTFARRRALIERATAAPDDRGAPPTAALSRAPRRSVRVPVQG
jgi:transposase